MGSTNPLGYSMLNGTTSAHQWIQGQKKKKSKLVCCGSSILY